MRAAKLGPFVYRALVNDSISKLNVTANPFLLFPRKRHEGEALQRTQFYLQH